MIQTGAIQISFSVIVMCDVNKIIGVVIGESLILLTGGNILLLNPRSISWGAPRRTNRNPALRWGWSLSPPLCGCGQRHGLNRLLHHRCPSGCTMKYWH